MSLDWRPKRIVSGGQTGADRGALEAALALGLEIGGYVPLGRLAEDGRVPDRYPMTECGSERYEVRTELNVLESDATLILHRGPLGGGSKLTAELCRKNGKPCLAVRLGRSGAEAGAKIRAFLRTARPRVLNVAGPRESGCPGIGEEVRALLTTALSPSRRGKG